MAELGEDNDSDRLSGVLELFPDTSAREITDSVDSEPIVAEVLDDIDPDEPPSVDRRASGRPYTPPGSFCRICHDRNLSERNLSPCYCRGSLALVHLSCLQSWLATSDTSHCEICGYQYSVIRIPKYPILKSMWYWYSSQRNTVEGRSILKNMSSLVFDAPLVFSLNYLWLTKVDGVLERMEEYARESLYLFDDNMMMVARMVNISLICPVGILSGGLLMVFAVRILDLVRRWYLWYRKECVLVVQAEDRPQPPVYGTPQ